MLTAVVAGLAFALGLAGALEGRRLKDARHQVPIRIHVNGTRGKSSVTRLIAAGLREAGITTLGKVTGTQARWIFPDGSERKVHRKWGRARIQEQAQALILASRLGCRALVAECMAIRPELQAVSEREILKSTIGIVTNARTDHADVMGWTRTSVARTLGNTVPYRGTLVCGDPSTYSRLEPIARDRMTKPVLATPNPLMGDGEIHEFHPPENIAVALTVLSLLGIDERTAIRGFQGAAPDPGAASWAPGVDVGTGRPVLVLDALAVNDPQSLERVMQAAVGQSVPPEIVLIYHHRHDRPERAAVFARCFSRWAREGVRWSHTEQRSRIERLWVTGKGGPPVCMCIKGLTRGSSTDPGRAIRQQLAVRSDPRVVRAAPDLTDGILVVACGNTRGAMNWQADFVGWQPVRLGRVTCKEDEIQYG